MYFYTGVMQQSPTVDAFTCVLREQRAERQGPRDGKLTTLNENI
jgi:hypothetical protein